MCGRYTETRREKALFKSLGVELPAQDMVTPRYNIAPTQTASVIVEGEDGTRALNQFKWGLIPFWAKDEKIGNSLINARCETVATKPCFRASFKKRRCLVLADGFFEWQKVGDLKQPIYIRKRGGEPFVFGGLWDRWKSPTGMEVESFSIVTVEPNELAAKVHNRMPPMLDVESANAWLNLQSSPELLGGFLAPYPADSMECFPVSTVVNSPKNIGPQCVSPIVQVTPAAGRAPGSIQPSLF